MMKPGLFFPVLLLIGVLAVPTQAQQKPTAPKPAASPSGAVLLQWDDIGRKLIAMAEDFPEDKYDFKPAPNMQSFAERLIHAAHANDFFTNGTRGEKAPAMDDPKRNQFKTKADVVASGCPSCMLQLRTLLQQRRVSIRVCHPVDLLAESCRTGK